MTKPPPPALDLYLELIVEASCLQIVVIEVYGDGLPDLTLLDVPGLPTEDKEEMHDLVQEMQKKVADDPDCLVVAIDW